MAALFAAALFLAACEVRLPSFGGGGADESTKLRPRVVAPGQPVPKGGGHYKVGSPYRIKGQLYVPSEVTHYERTGIASWYGELFHGRRTANGEIYDMEALTAAHPTLPLPSYVRVTNMRNGRSLVLRVNDRGPYARGRLIDLSWAAASLLKMRSSGTAPVRVEYLGRAPLNGNDRHERDYLARQPWAGPQVAYADSPGKAIARAGRIQAQSAGIDRSLKQAPVRIASAENRDAAGAAPPLPASRSLVMAAGERPMRAAPPEATAAMPEQVAASPAYYVEAGRFDRKSLAEELATILGEIAPASIAASRNGAGVLHLVRLGPFDGPESAHAAAERIRGAGLKEARVMAASDG